MRTFAIVGAALLAAAMFFSANASALEHNHRHCNHDGFFRSDDVEVSFDDGSITFTEDETDETVRITEEYELIVNDRTVHLDHNQRRLVEKYYDHFSGLTEDAIEFGKDAAKVGVDGAKLGVHALIGVLKLLSSDYDSDDLEVDLDLKGDKIERMAERIEKRGARLEKRAESLKYLHRELRHEIRELDELEWF
jgi:hypothetical protein